MEEGLKLDMIEELPLLDRGIRNTGLSLIYMPLNACYPVVEVTYSRPAFTGFMVIVPHSCS